VSRASFIADAARTISGIFSASIGSRPVSHWRASARRITARTRPVSRR